MKLIQYMQYLKILHDRYGDIDVKVKTTYEDISGEYNTEYTDASASEGWRQHMPLKR